MAFDFGSPNDSSDDEAVADVSAWQVGAKSKRTTPPRRTSGFQAVNQPPPEDIAMQSTPEPEPEPAPSRRSAPVAHIPAVTQPTVISSGEESSSDDEEEAAPVAPTAMPIEVEDNEDDIWATVDEVVEDLAAIEENEDSHVSQPPKQHSDSGEDEVPQAPQPSEKDSDMGENSDSLFIPTRTVEVVVSRDELDDDELADCVDLTAGGDAVRRVLSERENGHGLMQYTVEFEDYHVDEVSFASDLGSDDQQIIYIPSTCCLHLSMNITTIGTRCTNEYPSFFLTTSCILATAKKRSATLISRPRQTQSSKQRSRPNHDDQARGCHPQDLGRARRGKPVS
jgi:hypothetical protein